MTFTDEIRASIFGLGGQQIEEQYGPLARAAYENGCKGLGPHDRYAKGGVMYVFATEGIRQYRRAANVSRRVDRIEARRARNGMAG